MTRTNGKELGIRKPAREQAAAKKAAADKLDEGEKRLVADVPASLYWRIQELRIQRKQSLKAFLLDVLERAENLKP